MPPDPQHYSPPTPLLLTKRPLRADTTAPGWPARPAIPSSSRTSDLISARPRISWARPSRQLTARCLLIFSRPFARAPSACICTVPAPIRSSRWTPRDFPATSHPDDNPQAHRTATACQTGPPWSGHTTSGFRRCSRGKSGPLALRQGRGETGGRLRLERPSCRASRRSAGASPGLSSSTNRRRTSCNASINSRRSTSERLKVSVNS